MYVLEVKRQSKLFPVKSYVFVGIRDKWYKLMLNIAIGTGFAKKFKYKFTASIYAWIRTKITKRQIKVVKI